MAPRCYQSLDNGQRCNAPAIHGSKFCRHHDPQRPKQAAAESRDSETLELPPLLDKPSMLVALNQVTQALAAGRIKRSVAATLLSCIKLANRLIAEIAEAGLTVSPAAMPTGQDNAPRSLLAPDELVGMAAPARQQEITRLAASAHPQKPAPAFNLSDRPTDRFIQEMMAQVHQLSANGHLPAGDAREAQRETLR